MAAHSFSRKGPEAGGGNGELLGGRARAPGWCAAAGGGLVAAAAAPAPASPRLGKVDFGEYVRARRGNDVEQVTSILHSYLADRRSLLGGGGSESPQQATKQPPWAPRRVAVKRNAELAFVGVVEAAAVALNNGRGFRDRLELIGPILSTRALLTREVAGPGGNTPRLPSLPVARGQGGGEPTPRGGVRTSREGPGTGPRGVQHRPPPRPVTTKAELRELRRKHAPRPPPEPAPWGMHALRTPPAHHPYGETLTGWGGRLSPALAPSPVPPQPDLASP